MSKAGLAPITLLAALPPLFWAGNFVLARALHADIPPLALSFWRWLAALAILLPFTWPAVWRQRNVLLAHWPLLSLFALLGVAAYNSLLYLGLQYTAATNAVLLSAAAPVFIVMLTWAVFREPLRQRAMLGLVLSLAGVAVLVSQGSAQRLLALRLGVGDLWVLAAALDWALYSVLLRLRPAGLDPLAFLSALILLGLPPLALLYGWELLAGRGFAVDAASLGAIAYVALFPSVLAYIFWNRAVAELGANRTGQYIHLLPVFGTLLGVLVLGEPLAWYHAAGAMLIGGGILLSAAGSRGQQVQSDRPEM